MIDESSLPGTLNLPFVEELYRQYQSDPQSVSADWQALFQGLKNGDPLGGQKEPSYARRSIFNPGNSSRQAETNESEKKVASLQDRVDQLLRTYRFRGHMIAILDPLGRPRPTLPELDLGFYGLTEGDLDRRFSYGTLYRDGSFTLRDIINRLRNTYCRSIGVEFMHIDDIQVRRWLQKRMEGTENRLTLSRDEQIRILTRLTDAVTFEEFIRRKFIGAKSFSLEGSESLIPLLDLAIEKAADQGINEIVLGMAHRGRLNVLANIMSKNPRQIFREFADADPDLYTGRGDVKYHLGYSSDWTSTSGSKVHLSLCFNPSHLEFVNPVAMGRIRAKQDRAGDKDRTSKLTILVHGDAAFAGEGVLQESLNLSQLPGYNVGGALHVVINNQLGFTTSPKEGRSTTYATDVAKMLQIPIFHVNGEDPEAVAQVVRLAMDFRQTFRRDVVIDMYAYRRLGHNEGDEPSFTQPLLYRAISQRKPVREGYLDHLLQLKGVTKEEADEIALRRRELLETELSESRSEQYRFPTDAFGGVWRGYVGGPETEVAEVKTGVVQETLSALLRAQTKLPEGFNLHPKLKKFIENREEMAAGKQTLDWSAAESLAFASLATQGHRVRLTGQDCERGTFSHRHAVLHDYENGRTYVPLQYLAADQAPVEIMNSPLSETGVLGFEYGYSLDYPSGLVAWEAQFGDFVNAAQVIVDQFIISGEDKWRRLSGLVLLLPHGFEGQGPEHSSARLERFLALSAEDNIQVVYPTTPAQYFHCLRRQVMRRWRKPLVVMTPKSLLRHPKVVSTLDALAGGGFQRIIPEGQVQDRAVVRRIILCSGKIYYELTQRREELKKKDVAIIRLEQLYPLHREELKSALEGYREGTPAFWVQEEPENMGPWRHLRARFGETLLGQFPLKAICRPASASPATGSASSHKREQERVLAEALPAV